MRPSEEYFNENKIDEEENEIDSNVLIVENLIQIEIEGEHDVDTNEKNDDEHEHKRKYKWNKVDNLNDKNTCILLNNNNDNNEITDHESW